MPISDPFPKPEVELKKKGRGLPYKATSIVAEINGKKIYWLGIQTRWTPLHTKLLVMHNEGKSIQQMSKHLNLDIDVARTIVNAPMFQKRAEIVEERVIQTVTAQRTEIADIDAIMEARRLITDATIPAVLQLTKMSSEEGFGNRVMLEACKDILDRAGLKPITITETRERVYSPQEVTSAKAILEEAQDIVKRLSNQPSSFILSDQSIRNLGSSSTESSDGQPSSSPGDDRPLDVPAQPVLSV